MNSRPGRTIGAIILVQVRGGNCRRFATACLLAAGFGLLVSCAGTPPPPVADVKPELTAEQYFARGDYRRAAAAWEEHAGQLSGREAAELRVHAAEARVLSGDAPAALEDLDLAAPGELTAPYQSRRNLVLAEIALQDGLPAEAEQFLQQARQQLPVSMRERFEQLSLQARQMMSQTGSVDVRQSLALVTSSEDYQPALALQLLEALEVVPSSELAILSVNPRGNQNETAWLALALLMRQSLVDPASLQKDIESWKLRFPHHYLGENEALDLWLLYRREFGPPSKVAVLLPGAGRLQAAAEAIRDGIMSAFLDAPGGAELMFLSTGEDGEQVTAAYDEARSRGATWILGPLQKPAVESLLRSPGLLTPILALNDLPPGYTAPAGLAGEVNALSLSQDVETQALARQVKDGGFERLMVIAPETDWGERTVQIFSDEFLQGNGQIVASTRYLESENDHSAMLERVLKIDESKARKQQLENTLQMKLDFEPIRRDDVDVIFLVANPAQGRSLRPQLRFHGAGDIPVYAPGRIFTGRADSARDQDLNGVHFPITPLQLQPSATRSVSELPSLRGGSFTSLYALGMDAWNILPWLELMQRDPDFRFSGASGYYRVQASGELQREPAFAVFRGGRPVPMTRAANNTNLK